ncbi:hypothetical protein I308_105766 [Cryptococcus tetragattii IND107]|uniref:SET domain-containing protein n=1 Tax=Cryptococcus tetragattii IND107 TaxID=1296105 RepID=A0ABR3BK67_9TREE
MWRQSISRVYFDHHSKISAITMLPIQEDVSVGTEPLPIPISHLSTPIHNFTYITDSQLGHGTPLSLTHPLLPDSAYHKQPSSSPISSTKSDNSSDVEDVWTCTCASQHESEKELSLCTAKCGDLCDCVAQFDSASDKKRYGEGQGNYILSLRLPDQTIHIDPRWKGNVGRFLNHSCGANCVVHYVKWGGGQGWPRAAIFTNKNIHPEEELTFDYANASGDPQRALELIQETIEEDTKGKTRCHCRAEQCRGWMPFDETL